MQFDCQDSAPCPRCRLTAFLIEALTERPDERELNGADVLQAVWDQRRKRYVTAARAARHMNRRVEEVRHALDALTAAGLIERHVTRIRGQRHVEHWRLAEPVPDKLSPMLMVNAAIVRVREAAP